MRQNTINILAISRGSKFSPNHVTNDAAIFNIVVDNLKNYGCNVDICSEIDFVNGELDSEYIIDMARDESSISRLQSLEDKGSKVINSAYGIVNCKRRQMTELLMKNNIPYPVSYIIGTDEDFHYDNYPYWIKRGESHAIVKEDVCFVENKAQAMKVLEDFQSRGIECAIVNEHIHGDLIKFYGVEGTDFFYWFYPSPCVQSKFGLEKINGYSQGIPFDIDALKANAAKASQVLNVPIYGGDCVITEEGKIKIIDFNDWPSFARCREEAGPKIAECIYSTFIKNQQIK